MSVVGDEMTVSLAYLDDTQQLLGTLSASDTQTMQQLHWRHVSVALPT